MIKSRNDLIGQRFDRLVVIGQDDDYVSSSGKHYSKWICQCDCGSPPISVTRSNLIQKHVRSCGCLNKEIARISHKKYNNYELNFKDQYGIYGVGYCSNTGNKFYFDMEDYDKIKHGHWIEIILSNGYRSLQSWSPQSQSITRMHWVIVGKYYDHADRNPLNNRKYNLRKASFTENAQNQSISVQNKSGFIGVYWLERLKKWIAYITVNKKRMHLGSFSDKEDAIKARLQAEAKYFKKFAPQRHLFKQYGILEDDFLE